MKKARWKIKVQILRERIKCPSYRTVVVAYRSVSLPPSLTIRARIMLATKKICTRGQKYKKMRQGWAQAFFLWDTIWRDKGGQFGAWREFLESKNQFFLTMARIFHILARNWYNLARNFTFWEEFAHFGETRLALVRKNLELLLAGVSRQGKFLNFFCRDLFHQRYQEKRRGLVGPSLKKYPGSLESVSFKKRRMHATNKYDKAWNLLRIGSGS